MTGKRVSGIIRRKFLGKAGERIAENAADDFAASLVKLTDEEAKNAKFKVDFLRKGKELVGQAAAINNRTMQV